MDLSEDIIEWIERNKDCDTAKLRLSSRKNGMAMDFAILQIECRKKAQKKLNETLKCNKFIFPTSLSAEQCTSDKLASFHASLIASNCTILDMTAGLGIDVFHFADKAKEVTAVEINPDVACALKINAQNLGYKNIQVYNEDCVEYINKTDKHFDIIFIDPARRGSGGKRLFALSDCQPDVTLLLDLIRRKCDKLIIKASPMLDVTQVLNELHNVTDVYAIGTNLECKELLVVIDFTTETTNPKLHCITILNDNVIDFSFSHDDEIYSVPQYAQPQIGNYLYEPYPAVMKMLPIKYLSTNFSISKIEVNTHLYFSDKPINDFPGECYKITDIYPFASKNIKTIAQKYPKANITVRNFILSADDLQKKLKIKNGDEFRIFGVTFNDKSRQLIISQRNEPCCVYPLVP